MQKTDIERLRNLSIRSVASLLGIEVDERGRCLCPFHDDHRLGSCYVGTRGHNTLTCWSCGKRGVDTIALTQYVLGKTFPEACQYLAEQFGGLNLHNHRPPYLLKGEKGHMNTGTFGSTGHVNTGTFGPALSSNVSPSREVGVTKCHYEYVSSWGGLGQYTFDAERFARHFLHPVLNDAARHFLFEERHISPRVASWYRLNSWTDRHGTNWLELPYYSPEGYLIGVQNRRLTTPPITSPHSPSSETETTSMPLSTPLLVREGQGGGSSSPRFLFQPGSRTSTFGLQIIPYLKPSDELWIAEGSSDLLAMASAGHRGIAVASATLLRPEDFLPLRERGILRWRMVHDNDPAGHQLRDRIIQLANQFGASIIATPAPDGCKDFGEWWKTLPPAPPVKGGEQLRART